jgi:hypothetical protein
MPTFVAGANTVTWNALALGQTADGIRTIHQFFKRLITGDLMAESPQDAVYRGAEVALQFRLIQYDAAGIQTIKWPYSATKWDIGAVGRTDAGSAIAKSLVMTAVAGTPAATLPATFTALLSVLHENFPVEVLTAPDLKEVPIRLRVYPSTSGIFATET